MDFNGITHRIQANERQLMKLAMSMSRYNKMDAEDLYQNTVLKLLIHCDKYKEQEVPFFHFAAKVMRNKFLDGKRKEVNRGHHLAEDDFIKDGYDLEGFRAAFGYDFNDGLKAADIDFIYELVYRLPDQLRTAMIYRMQGYDHEYIADRMGTGLNTTLGRIRYARLALAPALRQISPMAAYYDDHYNKEKNEKKRQKWKEQMERKKKDKKAA